MVAPAFGAPSAPTTPSASASAYPRMVDSGVRSSCETDSRKSRSRPSLTCSAAGELVERGGQFGRLGRSASDQPDRPVAGGQMAGRGRRPPDRPDGEAGQQRAGQHAADQAGEQREPDAAEQAGRGAGGGRAG